MTAAVFAIRPDEDAARRRAHGVSSLCKCADGFDTTATDHSPCALRSGAQRAPLREAT